MALIKDNSLFLQQENRPKYLQNETLDTTPTTYTVHAHPNGHCIDSMLKHETWRI